MTVTPSGSTPDSGPTSQTETAPPPEQAGAGRTRSAFKEITLDLVGEGAVQTISCLLLAAAGFGVFWSWQHSPVLAVAALVLLVTGTVVAVTVWRHRGPLRARTLGTTLLTLLLLLALWFLLYGSNCGCL